MAKKRSSALSGVVNLAVWLTGVLVSLAVGFGMTDSVLTVRWIPLVVTQVAGWIVIILTLVSVILAIVDQSR
ncbi:hypothetical protein CMI42_05280 [Candidatus Pacearchaeota archaeon]|nr:hypothetical protein [Candidatus Pacearchaeota archaeon]